MIFNILTAGPIIPYVTGGAGAVTLDVSDRGNTDTNIRAQASASVTATTTWTHRPIHQPTRPPRIHRLTRLSRTRRPIRTIRHCPIPLQAATVTTHQSPIRRPDPARVEARRRPLPA